MQARASENPLLTSKLRKLFAEAKLPTNPALAATILKLIDDPKSSAADFASALRSDPALSTRLLKTANSVHFAQREPVTTIARAITVLGLNRVKTASLAFQLVTHLNKLGGTPFDMKMFWQDSLLRACLGHSIAEQVIPERREEAFLIALLLECGILLLVQVYGSSYVTLYRSGNLSPTAFYAVEGQAFPHTHVDAISVMASQWKLPDLIAAPLAQHHTRIELSASSSENERLCAVSYFVGGLRFAEGLTVDPAEESLQEYGRTVLDLDDAAWTLAQQRAAEEYQRLSKLYRDIIPEDVDVAELLGEANRQLASAASAATQRVLNVEAERVAIEREQRGLESALREYRERAALDPLTNVLNRGALTDSARQAIENQVDQGTSIAAFFLDLDNFKRLNDKYGHKIGDRALKAVATLLVREVGRMGTVGRYGGGGFGGLLRGLSAESVRQLAEQIVVSVRGLDSGALGFPGQVTCSLGAVWSDRPAVSSAEELFAAADELMYRAKRGGKDCCCFGLLAEPYEDVAGGVDDHSAAGATGGNAPRVGTGERHKGSTGDDPSLRELLAIAGELNKNDVDTFSGIRKEERKKLTVGCAVNYFTGNGAAMGTAQAATRSVSTGGIGLLLARPLARGEAVEIVLDKGTSQLFLAGIVAFCRHIVGRVHDVGVQFVTHSVSPIISGAGSSAAQDLDWVARTLRAKQSRTQEQSQQDRTPELSGRASGHRD